MNVRFGVNTVIDPKLRGQIETHWLDTMGETMDRQFPGHDVTMHFERTKTPKGALFPSHDAFFKVRIETPTQPDVEIGPRALMGLRSFTHVTNLADAIGAQLSKLTGKPYDAKQAPMDFLEITHRR